MHIRNVCLLLILAAGLQGEAFADEPAQTVTVIDHRPKNWYTYAPDFLHPTPVNQNQMNGAGGGSGAAPATPQPEDKPPANNNADPDCANPTTGHPVIIATGQKVKD